MSGDLDSFLKGGTPAEEAAPAPPERAPLTQGRMRPRTAKVASLREARPAAPRPDDDAEQAEDRAARRSSRAPYEKERARRQTGSSARARPRSMTRWRSKPRS